MTSNGGTFEFQWMASAIISLLYGIAFGLVGCLLATPGKNGEQFKRSLAFGITAGLVFLFTIIQVLGGSLGLARNFYLPNILATLIFLTFLIGRAFPKNFPATMPDGTEIKKIGSPAPALSLGFLPSAILLLLLPLAKAGNPPAALLILCCGISIVCCFTASFLLFRRGTGLAIFGGILFILLNAFVSFLFGCGAMLTGMKF